MNIRGTNDLINPVNILGTNTFSVQSLISSGDIDAGTNSITSDSITCNNLLVRTNATTAATTVCSDPLINLNYRTAPNYGLMDDLSNIGFTGMYQKSGTNYQAGIVRKPGGDGFYALVDVPIANVSNTSITGGVLANLYFTDALCSSLKPTNSGSWYTQIKQDPSATSNQVISLGTMPAGIVSSAWDATNSCYKLSSSGLSSGSASLSIGGISLPAAGSGVAGIITADVQSIYGAKTFIGNVLLTSGASLRAATNTGMFMDGASGNLQFQSSANGTHNWTVSNMAGYAQFKVFNTTSNVGAKVQTYNNILDSGTGVMTILGDILPTTTATASLGSPTYKFKDVNLSGSANIAGTMTCANVLNGGMSFTSFAASTNIATVNSGNYYYHWLTGIINFSLATNITLTAAVATSFTFAFSSPIVPTISTRHAFIAVVEGVACTSGTVKAVITANNLVVSFTPTASGTVDVKVSGHYTPASYW